MKVIIIDVCPGSNELRDYFIGQNSKTLDNEILIYKYFNFSIIISYFLDIMFKSTVSWKKFVIKIQNKVMGELGLTVILYKNIL